MGRPCGQILRSEICDTERCPFERSLLGGETVTTFNIMAKDATGTETPICINTSPLKNAKGEVVGVVETIRVVTHINRLIEELREQRNKVQAVLDSIAEGVFTVDRDGMVTSFNRTAEQILGCAAGRHVLGRRTQTASRPRSAAPASPLDETLHTGRVVRNRELVVTLVDRRKAIPLSVCTGPFRDEHGATLGSGVHVSRSPGDRADRRRAPTADALSRNHREASPHARDLRLVEMIKDSDSTVLLQGESGTGKDCSPTRFTVSARGNASPSSR